eukprot:SAG11_NODE_15036_length_591_cov_0.835366_1_plen_33_part_01
MSEPEDLRVELNLLDGSLRPYLAWPGAPGRRRP